MLSDVIGLSKKEVEMILNEMSGEKDLRELNQMYDQAKDALLVYKQSLEENIALTELDRE